MASNGLLRRAKRGRCRVCYRTRDTSKHVEPVDEVRHGYAIGYVWQCRDKTECLFKAFEKIARNDTNSQLIEIALRKGYF